jgi:hypothetical protein
MHRFDKPGKPVTHKPVMHVETGKIFKTYSEAAESVNGNRWGVRYTAMGIQHTHMGQHFVYVNTKQT